MRLFSYLACTSKFVCLFFSGLPVLLGSAQAQESQEPVFFERIAIAPFFVGRQQPWMDQDQGPGRQPDPERIISCPISELCIYDPSISPEAGPILTRMAYEQLRRRFPPHVVDPDQSREAYARIALDEQQDTLRTMSRKMGELLDADKILIGTVWRYRDRGDIEAIPGSPASVAFALYLVQADSGKLVWRQSYEGTQETVTSNLINAGKRIKMGITWLSAPELARHGMGEAFGQFPDRLEPIVTPRVRESVDFEKEARDQ